MEKGYSSGTLPRGFEPRMSVYVGLDCGGSSSRVLALDSEGKVVYQGQSGGANLVSTPDARLRRNLYHATEGCPPANYVCGCFAGLVNEDLRKRGEELLRQHFPGAEVRAEPDYTAALFACPSNITVCVIAGTGSLVCSRVDGHIHKSGGRGYILGDDGSGFQFGRDAVVYFLDNPEECSQSLREAIKAAFGSTTDEGSIVSQVYRLPTPAMTLAKLSKALALDAKAGETYALASIERNTSKLAGIVAAHAARYHSDETILEVGLVGGVWNSAAIIRQQFEQHLRQLLPLQDVRVQKVNRPPLYGAVEIAKEMSHRN